MLTEDGPSLGDARARGDALQRLVDGLARARTPSEIAKVTVEIAAELLGADAAAVYVPGPPTTAQGTATLRALHAIGWPASTIETFKTLEPRRGRPLSDAVLTGVPVWVHDARSGLSAIRT